jgi:hypothetical protein
MADQVHGASAAAAENGHDEVTVELNGAPRTIHRGSYTTQELKQALGVDQSLELDLFEGGKFVELPDGKRTVVREGMVFISHVRQGGSS